MFSDRVERAGKHGRLTLFGVVLVYGGLLACAGVPGVNDLAREPPDVNVVRVAENLDVVAREPMVAHQPDGTLLVAGYGEPTPTLWRSRNGGLTWSRVDLGSAAAGAIGNSDVDLHAAGDGTVYIATLVFDRSAPAGTHISVAASTDGGATWKWTLISNASYVDRPWVATAPNGTAYVTWNDREGVHLAASRDRGLTWIERSRVCPDGGSSHFAVGPNGELAVRVTPFSFFGALRVASGSPIDATDLIAVSSDGGATWRTHDVPGRREWTRETALAVPAYGRVTAATPPRWVEPIAWDAHGALFSLWTNRTELWVARSDNRGATWTSWRILDGGEVRYFPYLIARGDGELVATWFSGRGATLRAHAALIRATRAMSAPRISVSQPFTIDAWIGGRTAADSPVRDTAGEYLGVAFVDNAAVIVSPIVNAAANRFGFALWKVESPTPAKRR